MSRDIKKELERWRSECRQMKPFTDMMIHYKALVDNKLARGMTGRSNMDWDRAVAREWKLKVSPMLNELPNFDYIDNVLFICDKPCARTTFFAAFCNMGVFVDFRYMGLLFVQDLFNGVQNRAAVPMNLYGINSFQDIREDVLLTYASSTMTEVGRVPEFWTTLIAAKSAESGLVLDKQITWIYFEGTIEELRNSPFSSWEAFFEKTGVIIDLNPIDKMAHDDIFLGDVRSVSV